MSELDTYPSKSVAKSNAAKHRLRSVTQPEPDPGDWMPFTAALRASGYKSSGSFQGLIANGRIRTRPGSNGCKEYFRPDVEACNAARGNHKTGRTPGPRGPAAASVGPREPLEFTTPRIAPAAPRETTLGHVDFDDFIEWMKKGESGYFSGYEALKSAVAAARE